MGWLQGLRFRNSTQLLNALPPLDATTKPLSDSKAEVAHIENLHIEDDHHEEDGYDSIRGEAETKRYRNDGGSARRFHSEDVPDSDLPFISKEEVISKKLKTQPRRDEQKTSEAEELWIVVDNIVYDCSDFVTDHPGGEQVIRSFLGEDCSWQFWRFHGQKEMLQYGRALRIGRTAGVQNRFVEVPRYIGPSRSDDDW